MTDKPVRRTVARPAPDDLVRVRYVLPSSMVTKMADGVEVHTCKGGKVAIPQSVLAATEPDSTSKKSTEPSSYVVIEALVRRDIGRLLGSLVAEVTRLTREVNELEKKSLGTS